MADHLPDPRIVRFFRFLKQLISSGNAPGKNAGRAWKIFGNRQEPDCINSELPAGLSHITDEIGVHFIINFFVASV